MKSLHRTEICGMRATVKMAREKEEERAAARDRCARDQQKIFELTRKNICVQDAAGGDAEAEGEAGGGEQSAGRQLPHQGRHGSGQRPRILLRVRLQGSQGQRLRQREELSG